MAALITASGFIPMGRAHPKTAAPITTAMTTNWPQSDKGQPASPTGTDLTPGHHDATQPM